MADAHMTHLTIATTKKREVVDITAQITDAVARARTTHGLCIISVAHTTAAITTADLDPGGTDLDYIDALTGMVPDLPYRHPHDPEHMPDHILASLIGPSVTVPIEKSAPILGTWQKIVLFEFDGPRERDVAVSII